jgi:FtsH-binding integral membrane protein
MTKVARTVLRTTAAVLWVLLLIVYLAAKFNFFTRYGTMGVSGYVQQHSPYWLGMAAIAFVIWIMQKVSPEEPRSK